MRNLSIASRKAASWVVNATSKARPWLRQQPFAVKSTIKHHIYMNYCMAPAVLQAALPRGKYKISVPSRTLHHGSRRHVVFSKALNIRHKKKAIYTFLRGQPHIADYVEHPEAVHTFTNWICLRIRKKKRAKIGRDSVPTHANHTCHLANNICNDFFIFVSGISRTFPNGHVHARARTRNSQTVGLVPDVVEGKAFVSVVVAEHEAMRPAEFPSWMGTDFTQVDYRANVKAPTGERGVRNFFLSLAIFSPSLMPRSSLVLLQHPFLSFSSFLLQSTLGFLVLSFLLMYIRALLMGYAGGCRNDAGLCA